jgi:16S rRNA (guanine966-N2)-methyltransferase
MYITGGKLKGRKLASCKGKSIRPAMGLVRKSIFDTLNNFIEGTNVMDLCAGTGVLGIEAISRGAEKLTLIDSDKLSIKLIQKNLELCNMKANVIRGRLPDILNKLNNKNEEFNLIFIDPPYGQPELIKNVLELIVLNKLISNNGIISIETEAKNNFEIPPELKIKKEKRYGNTKVTFLTS